MIFVIKPFLFMTKKVKTKTWMSWERKELLRWNKKKNFHRFYRAFNCQKLSQTLQCTLNWCSVFAKYCFNFGQFQMAKITPCQTPNTQQVFATGVENKGEGSSKCDGGGLSQYMEEHGRGGGGLKRCWKIPVKEFIC